MKLLLLLLNYFDSSSGLVQIYVLKESIQLFVLIHPLLECEVKPRYMCRYNIGVYVYIRQHIVVVVIIIFHLMLLQGNVEEEEEEE